MNLLNQASSHKIRIFRKLHQRKPILILPNAWDILSAKLFAQAGAKAIGTTSAGIAASFGFADGQKLPKDLFLSATEQIIRAVNIPVTVDIEAGYADDLAGICDTVQSIIAMGGVGINIEDSIPGNLTSLEDISVQCKKIAAIRALAQKNNCALFINARTDVYWLKQIPAEQRFDMALQRLQMYQNCGADGLFIPGLTDLTDISRLTQKVNLPINILGGSWISSIATLEQAGVSRVSVGSAPCRATAMFIQHIANRLTRKKDFSIFTDVPSYEWLNGLFGSGTE